MDLRMQEQQKLDFAAAEGVFRERLSTLGNLVKVVGASGVQANVLRFIFDEGGFRQPVELWIEKIAGLPWIQSGEKTVRRAINFWEELGIIEIERDRRGANRQAPNTARLLRSSVLRRLCGETRCVASPSPPAAGEIESLGDRSGRRFSGGQFDPGFSGGQFDPGFSGGQFDPSDGQFDPSDGQFDHLKPLAHTVLYARVRALGLSSSVCTDVVDVSADARENFGRIYDLAEEARRPLYPGHWPRDPQVRATFVQASVLGTLVLSREWVLAATRATQAAPKAAGAPWRYWVGCLRNGLVEIAGLEPFQGREECVSYFSRLMHAVAPIAAAVIAHCGEAGPVAAIAAASPPPEPCPAGLAAEFRTRLAQRRGAPP